MEFTHQFSVPADIETTFRTLIDLEKVAPCMPGATLEEVEGGIYTGRMKVKVGPVQIVYRGTAQVTEVDQRAKQASISANGKETRGAGTAKADVTAVLHEQADGTLVTVASKVDITGKPAQFGRGVIADVGETIIGQFAQRLETLLGEARATSGSTSDGDIGGLAGAQADVGGFGATGSRAISQDVSAEDNVLDLVEIAGVATLKRVAPVAVGILVLMGFVFWRRRR